MALQCSAGFQGAAEPLPRPPRVVGMGGCGVDYLAAVAAYPKPDEKLRTERLEVQGGGNCGNALTAAARLGLAPAIVTKIGGDALGDGILAELQGDGVDTALVLRAAGAPSPFTYIIVDQQGSTRTCIHTPGEAFLPEELTPELAASALQGACLAYFDGRLTEAALQLAAAARAAGVPVLVEAERLRPGLEQLLCLADYVVTSAHFPAAWTGEGCLGDALVVTLGRLPNARWVVTTLGARGSVLLERPPSQQPAAAAAGEAAAPAAAEMAQALLEQLFEEAAGAEGGSSGGGDPAPGDLACVSASGVEIRAGGLASAAGPVALQLVRGDAEAAQVGKAARAAAEAEAAANADRGNGGEYGSIALAQRPAAVVAHVTVALVAALPPEAVVDTTGAGDSFIGSLLYGIATGKPMHDTLRLASVVAACKCTALGARPGLPRRADLHPALLSH